MIALRLECAFCDFSFPREMPDENDVESCSLVAHEIDAMMKTHFQIEHPEAFDPTLPEATVKYRQVVL